MTNDVISIDLDDCFIRYDDSIYMLMVGVVMDKQKYLDMIDLLKMLDEKVQIIDFFED